MTVTEHKCNISLKNISKKAVEIRM